MKKKTSIIKTIFICLLLVAGSLAISLSAPAKIADAAGTPDSCTPPATTYGTDSWSSANSPADPIYVPATATYTIWVRMQAPSASANSILLNIDGTNCYNVGGDSSIPTDGSTWDWVDDYGGDTSNIMNVSLTQGSHNFELTGTESGVAIDGILAIATSGGSPSCTPSTTGTYPNVVTTCGDNGTLLDNTASAPPVVSVTAPSSGATVSGTTTVSATATDPGATDSNGLAIASVQFELNGSPLGSPVLEPDTGTNTFSYSWDTSSLGTSSPASESISAIATDTSGYTTTTGATSVTVDNSTGGGGSTPPTTPAGLHVTTNTGTSVALSWTASTDSGGTLTGYHVYLNGNTTPVASVSGTSYTATGLTPGTAYSYTVAAYDGANTSSKSTAVSGTTCIAGDVNCDGSVNISDLTLMGRNWNTTSGATWAEGDLNGDGQVNITDLTILGRNWGQ